MRYYFLKSVTQNSRLLLKPYSGQFFEDGTPVAASVSVSTTAPEKGAVPIGSDFAVEGLSLVGSRYVAHGKLYVLNNPNYTAPPEAIRQFEDLMAGVSPHITPKAVKDKPLTYFDRLKANKKFKPPTPEKHGFYVDVDKWYMMLRNANAGINTLLVGPTGCGKTAIIKYLAECLSLPIKTYDMGAMKDPVSGLLGVHRIKNGASVFDRARFTYDISEPGIVLLDELSRAPITSNNILFPVLDDRRELYLDTATGEDDRIIKVHEDVVFIATANIGSAYVGTNQLDPALTRRFFTLELNYPPRDVEVSLLVKRCNIKPSEASMIVKCFETIRTSYEAQNLSASVSTAEAITVGNLVFDGMDVHKSLRYVILPKFEGSESEGERMIVSRTISGIR